MKKDNPLQKCDLRLSPFFSIAMRIISEEVIITSKKNTVQRYPLIGAFGRINPIP